LLRNRSAALGGKSFIGGAGVDQLDGGDGSDIFRFFEGDTLLGAEADTIVKFARGTDDIDLSAIDAQSGAAGDQAFIFLGTGAFTQQQGQLRYQIEGSNSRLQADQDGDGVADFEIILAGTGNLAGSDFLL
jgi:Ca2+-binding RTX toxin-like protein